MRLWERRGVLQNSYLMTLSFLIFHQIDAAYWHEWDMFYLPGGIQGYLLFNILAVPVLLVGYKKVVEVSPAAIKYAYFCASLGGLTFVIHALFFKTVRMLMRRSG